MSHETFLRIRRIYNILLSIVLVVAGICTAIGCCLIYYSGTEREQIYTVEVIRETFLKFSFPILLGIGMTLLNFVADILETIFFYTKEKTSGKMVDYLYLRTLLQKKDYNNDSSVAEQIKNEHSKRMLLKILSFVILIVCCIPFLIFVLNPSNFQQTEVNGFMVSATTRLILCLIVPFIYALVSLFVRKTSVNREIELLKQSPKKEDSNKNTECPKEKWYIPVLRYGFLGIGIAIFVYGLIAGGTADVLTKAINICTECIGLG